MAGHRTIYVAGDEETAYLEVLAYLAPSVGLEREAVASVFTEGDAGAGTILDAIDAEWAELFSMGVRKIVTGWRQARFVYDLDLPPDGWFVDVGHSDTLVALNRRFGDELRARAITRLTSGHLYGEDRDVTTAVAGHIHASTLSDGTRPHGLLYRSKHGVDRSCWAVWLRRLDDGFDVDAEPTRAHPGREIEAPALNPALQRAQDALGLVVL